MPQKFEHEKVEPFRLGSTFLFFSREAEHKGKHYKNRNVY